MAVCRRLAAPTERASNVSGGLRVRVGGYLTPMSVIGILAFAMSQERRRAGLGGGAVGESSLGRIASCTRTGEAWAASSRMS